ncbi:MAG: AbrB/MazE/SpoVT family DNA-binding domain-containing protein [Betaproteobacteria bacterium]|nr:AbrB/MazE/SpoVT family DNA-binding domain-containing protein [Betaproteobacteria bacterium]
MTTLTVTAKGQVTLKQDLLRHLGVAPGQKVSIDTLPDGRAVLRAAHQGAAIDDAFGILKASNKRKRALSIEEMNAIVSHAWAGKL